MRRGKSGRAAQFAVGSAVLTMLAAASTGCSSGGNGSSSAPVSLSPSSASSSSAPVATSPVPTTATTAPVAPPTTPAPTTSTPTTSASVSQSSGSYLKTLLPANAMEAMLGLGPTLPTGWTAHPEKEQDSGPTATAAAPSLVGAGDCDYLIHPKVAQAGGLDLAGGLSVASASEPVGSGTEPVGLAFYAYRPGDAAKSLAQIRQNLTSTCDRFSETSVGSVTVDVVVSATAVSGLGDEALLVKVTPQGAYVGQENLLVRHGDLMLSLWSLNVYGDLPDLSPAAAALIRGAG
ncbi:hypothetical protein ABH935_000442 [Catenulispora sp. GAS73]|uniref:hypothetical protein n=1 Tax=Catenulispora sp. GAS73 TaxID=3156269 RepID=UPI0035148FA0